MTRFGGPLELPERPDRLARSGSSLMAWGIAAGLLLPIVGVVIGIVLLARDEIGPGLAVLVTCALGTVLAVTMLGV
jgi:hypothetical protein